MRVAVTQRSVSSFDWKLGDTYAVLAFAKNIAVDSARGYLTLQRSFLDLCLSQFLHRGVYALIEIVQPSSHLVSLPARTSRVDERNSLSSSSVRASLS